MPPRWFSSAAERMDPGPLAGMADPCRACGGYHRLGYDEIAGLIRQSVTARGVPWRHCRCACCADWGSVIPSMVRRAFDEFHREVLGAPSAWSGRVTTADTAYLITVAAQLSEVDCRRLGRLLSPFVPGDFAEFEAALLEAARCDN